MPANTKYLSSNWQRFGKITAGFIGGFIVTITLHIALAFFFNHKNIIITSSFTGFILWVVLMIIAFLAKNGWKIWAIYLAFSFLLSIAIYLGKMYNPII
ncbi:hypothetical protein KO500_08455 [Cellulophaga baltica]|uniref:hypothetical protein n=1 Tax=Cellulophaga TaxID=104264 RepID=UPI001C07E961|nr:MULTISPECIES: hypothetical protein [Cellulophaga]MBU2996464.1 hypothetical protein [Cellulophaga baltica]MDO6767858.1 hypothetical protein [Cellulophaga sp. 1_MG-2023]